MMRLLALVCVLGLSLVLTETADAQAGPAWNRNIVSVDFVTGSASGLFDINVRWDFQVGPTSTPLNLGTTVQVLVNGVPAGEMVRTLNVDAGSGICGAVCGDPCGSAVTDQTLTLYCDQTTCECGPGGSISAASPIQGDESIEIEDFNFSVQDLSLLVGDEITVNLIPTAGALPDTQVDDDTRTIVFTGLEARPGDSDGDDDQDLLDFARFQRCFGATGVIPPECTFADINEDRVIDKQDYDGFDLTGPIFPCQTIGLALNWPFGGEDAVDWVSNNYWDHDPAAGSACEAGVEDHEGGGKTYDGHTGVDINPASFRAMDGDFPVRAAQAGRVVSATDSHFDRNIAWMDGAKSNLVRIRHPNKFETEYKHLKKDSVTVAVGQWVQAGQIIGVVGSSGYSSACHLHFSVYDCDDDRFDPFAAGMWLNAPAYTTPLGAMELWLKDGQIDSTSETKDPTTDVQSLSPGDDLGIGLVTGGGRPGDNFEIKIRRGDGTVFDTIDNTWSDEQCRAQKRWRWNRVIDSTTGEWTVQVRVNGALKITKSFDVN